MTARQPSPKRHIDRARAVGPAVTSCAGICGAVSIAAAHGGSPLALLVFGTTQIWGTCELLCWWRMRWRYERLYESIARKAEEQPDNQHLRTLLADIASTHLDDLGQRLPVRRELR